MSNCFLEFRRGGKNPRMKLLPDHNGRHGTVQRDVLAHDELFQSFLLERSSLKAHGFGRGEIKFRLRRTTAKPSESLERTTPGMGALTRLCLNRKRIFLHFFLGRFLDALHCG